MARRRWTGDETIALLRAICRYGRRWTDIKGDAEFNALLGRSAKMLKGKWENIQKSQQQLADQGQDGALSRHLRNIQVGQIHIVVEPPHVGEGVLANWSADETAALRNAVNLYGEDNNPWMFILEDPDYGPVFQDRLSHHLEDMWHFLQDYYAAVDAAGYIVSMQAATAAVQQMLAGIHAEEDPAPVQEANNIAVEAAEAGDVEAVAHGDLDQLDHGAVLQVLDAGVVEAVAHADPDQLEPEAAGLVTINAPVEHVNADPEQKSDNGVVLPVLDAGVVEAAVAHPDQLEPVAVESGGMNAPEEHADSAGQLEPEAVVNVCVDAEDASSKSPPHKRRIVVGSEDSSFVD